MRTRKWVLVVFVLSSIAILIVYHGWRLLRANDKIKNFVLTELQPILATDFEIGRVRVGLGMVHFEQVALTSKDQRFNIVISDLRIGYNPVSLLIHGFDPKRISEDILLVRPRLIIHHLPNHRIESNRSPADSNSRNGLAAEYQNGIKSFGFFKHLSVSDGEIVIVDTSGVETRAAHEISGWIVKTNNQQVDIDLAGCLFNSKETNLAIEGRVDLTLGDIEFVRLWLRGYELDNDLPPFLPPFIETVAGQVDAELLLTKPDDFAGHFDLNGHFILADGALQLTESELSLQDLSCHAIVRHWNLVIEQGRCNVNSSDVELAGEIHNLLNPEFDLTLKADSLDLKSLTTSLFQGLKNSPSGIAAVEMSIQGHFTDTRLDGVFRCRRAQYRQQEFNNFTALVSYQRSQLLFSPIKARWFNHQVTVKSQVDLSMEDPIITGSIEGSGDLLPLVSAFATDSIISCRDWLEAEISGSLNYPVVDGKITVALVPAEGDSVRWVTDFGYANESLSLSSPIQNGEPKLYGRIDNFVTQPSFSLSLDHAQLPLLALFHLPWERKLRQGMYLDIQASGTLDKHKLSTSLRWKKFAEPEITLLNLQTERRVKENRTTWNGRLAIYPNSSWRMDGEFLLKQEAGSLNLEKFRIDDMVTAWLTLDATPGDQGQLAGNIILKDIELNKMLDASDSTCFGWLSTDISIAGTCNSPEIRGAARLYDMFYNNSGPFNCIADFEFANSTFKLERLLLNKDITTILYAKGNFWGYQDSTHLIIKGAGFDVSTVLAALTGKKDFLKGETLVDLEATGSPLKPSIFGTIAIKQGSIGSIGFDCFSVRFGSENQYSDARSESQVNSSVTCELDLIRDKQFRIHGSGQVPLDKRSPLHFQLQGEGNFLSILPDLHGYFQQAESAGELYVDIDGTLVEPVVNCARFVFRDASLQFSSVVPKVRELSGDIRFISEQSFVHVVDLYGKMDGEPFRINNVPASPSPCARQLEPFVASDLAVNFGVFQFETTKRGVPLNIIGLMERDDFGHFVMFGREEGERFYLAGPVARPVLRGRLMLENVNVMYPFQKSAGRMSSGVKNFLRSVDWDLRVEPGTDARYVKELPGAVGNVYVNLQLDEGYGGLEFSGQLDDDSFRIEGELRSNRGLIEYIDMNFRLEQAGVVFDRGMLQPVVYGKARSTVIDSTGQASQVFLTLETVDRTLKDTHVTEKVKQERSRARWSEIRFKLSTDNPNLGTTEGQVLAALGYSENNIQEKAFDAIGIRTDNLLFRPLFRPFERRLERSFGLDYVRFSSRFTRNLIAFNLNDNEQLNTKLALLRSTKIVVGKYLADRFFLLYTGQLETGLQYRYQEKGLGLHHTLGLEYQISPQLLLEMEYDYDSLHLLDRDDKRILLRHWFPF